jgi:hypothetical protein
VSSHLTVSDTFEGKPNLGIVDSQQNTSLANLKDTFCMVWRFIAAV